MKLQFPPPMCDPVTMWTLLATGFTGALTLVFLVRFLVRLFTVRPSAEVFSSPAEAAQAVVRELKRARDEVLVSASALNSTAVAEALVAAKGRGVRVEVVFDAENLREKCDDLNYLVEQGLAPLVHPQHRVGDGKVLILDRRTLFVGDCQFGADAAGESGRLMLLKGHGAVIRSYRDMVLTHKSQAGEVPAKTSLPPQSKAA